MRSSWTWSVVTILSCAPLGGALAQQQSLPPKGAEAGHPPPLAAPPPIPAPPAVSAPVEPANRGRATSAEPAETERPRRAAVPCGRAARETDGTTTCIGSPGPAGRRPR